MINPKDGKDIVTLNIATTPPSFRRINWHKRFRYCY
jgi:hypothetical protein